jgi:hypothetical protein
MAKKKPGKKKPARGMGDRLGSHPGDVWGSP